jgi:hypothetical protein
VLAVYLNVGAALAVAGRVMAGESWLSRWCRWDQIAR